MRTFEATIDVTNVALRQDAEGLREVDERRTLAGVGPANADNRNLGEAAGVCFQDGIDKSGSADADRGDVGGGNGCDFEDLADGVFDAFGDVGGGGRLVVGEDATGGLVETGDVDEDTVGVCACRWIW